MARNFDLPVETGVTAAEAWGLSGGGAPVWWYPGIYDAVHEKPAILIWDPDIHRYPQKKRRRRDEEQPQPAAPATAKRPVPAREDLPRPSVPLQWLRKWQAPGHPIQVRPAVEARWSWPTFDDLAVPAVPRPRPPQVLPWMTVLTAVPRRMTVPLPELAEWERLIEANIRQQRQAWIRQQNEDLILALLDDD